jgi:hypothetical protein
MLGTLHEDQQTFFIISHFFLECDMFQKKFVEEIKTHILCSKTCF